MAEKIYSSLNNHLKQVVYQTIFANVVKSILCLEYNKYDCSKCFAKPSTEHPDQLMFRTFFGYSLAISMFPLFEKKNLYSFFKYFFVE